jgi:hypothetical protein
MAKGELVTLRTRLDRSRPSADHMAELRERDFDPIWNKVKAIALGGGLTLHDGQLIFVNADTQLRACELLLAYMEGRPTAKMDVNTNISDQRQRMPADLSKYTTQELEAIRVLQQGAQRRALEDSDEGDE